MSGILVTRSEVIDSRDEGARVDIGPGTVLGGYRIERMLGSGGMGTVYLAEHPALPRYDALKVLWPHLASDPEYRARFEREAKLAAALDHPNIVAVQNKGEDRGCLWIALQYVNGADAAAVQEREPSSMSPERALRIVSEVGKGLDHAHRAGLLHRDIKPANFLLAPQSHGEERVLLADFGVAKPSDDATKLTRTGTFVATLAYASPEQLSGGHLDSRSDIYSLGCSFYRLITGRNPYPGTQPLVVMMGHITEPAPRITDVRPELPPALDDVLARVLAKDPADRYATCAEFAAAAADALAAADAVSTPVPVAVLATERFEPLRAQPSDDSEATVVRGDSEVTVVLDNTRPPRRAGRFAIAAILLAAPIIGIAALVVNGSPGASGPSGTTAETPTAQLGDPCLLVTDPASFDLIGNPSRTDESDGRVCTWYLRNAGSGTVSVSLHGRQMAFNPKAQSFPLDGNVDAAEVSTPAGSGTVPKCSVAWEKPYGYIEVAIEGGTFTDANGMCKQTEQLATAVYQKAR